MVSKVSKLILFAGTDIGKKENALTLMLVSDSSYTEKNRILKEKSMAKAQKKGSKHGKAFIKDPSIVYRGMFKNQLSGFRKMTTEINRAIRNLGKDVEVEVHVAMEATGTYYLKLARYFHNLQQKQEEGSNRKYMVYVLNPRQVKHFAHFLNADNQNDKVDSGIIARYIRSAIVARDVEAREWIPAREGASQMRNLARTRESLIKMRTMEQNRIEALSQDPEHCRIAMKTHKDHWEYLDERIDELEYVIKDNAKQGIYSDMQEDIELLCSIPGISEVTAINILSEIVDIKRFEKAKHFVGFSGMHPSRKTSGTSVNHRGKLSKHGNNRVRHYLYMTTMCAIQHNPVIKEYYQRLLNREGQDKKKKIVALIACMRKMLHIIYGVLKNKTAFDPEIAMAHCK
jgi:transposase